MNTSFKLLIGSVIAFIVIISSIMIAFSVLKEEAVNNYITISKLNAKSMSKEINQDISNIEQSIKNISSILDLHTINVSSRLSDIQRNYPQIRSINILKNNEIIYSSNEYNKGLILKELNLFPESIFDESILKVSTPWIGRDFVSASDVYTYEDKIVGDESFFIPISKKITTESGEFIVIINLNNDYFINRFLTNIDSNKVIFELVRLDGILLLTTDETKSIGKHISETKLLQSTIEKNEVTDIEIIDGVKYIVTYILTDNYPINLSVKLNYEKNLLAWNQKEYNFFLLTTIIIITCILLSLFFFYLFNKKKEEEVKLHKLQIVDQEKFKILFQDSHFMAVIMNEKGIVIDINFSALKFLNKKLDQIKGIHFWELECWGTTEKEYLRKIFIENTSEIKVNSEIKAISSNGTDSIIEFNLTTLNLDNKCNYIVTGIDITERKEREKKLTQAFTVYNNTRDGIMITDKFCNILDVNKAFEKITGYEKSEVLNKHVRLLKSNKYEIDFYEKMWESIIEKGFWGGEIINFKKDGSFFTEWLTIDTIYGKNKEIINYIGIFSDISEQKRKDQLLKEKEKMIYQQSKMAAMGEMIENIAHQWRQPLSIISTSATGTMMQKELNILTDEDEIKALKSINESAQFLSNTIEDFRSYLKNDDKQDFFNLTETIDYTLKLFSSKLINREIEIIKDSKLIKVWGTRNKFVQVLINIISNANDAFENCEYLEKCLIITISEQDEYVEVIIKDNAGGIPIEIIDKVFDPYFTTKHQSQGTGIGLYMSAEIIRNHMNGFLSVQNEEFVYKNKSFSGACFSIKLNKN